MSAIPPFSPPHVPNVHSTSIPQSAQQLRKQMEKFHDLLPPTSAQLEPFAQATLALNDVSSAALPSVQNPTTRLMEDLQNAASLAQTVLNQPLEIEGATPGVTLVTAAKQFQTGESSDDLAKVAQTLSNYGDSTESLKVELHQAISDLGKA